MDKFWLVSELVSFAVAFLLFGFVSTVSIVLEDYPIRSIFVWFFFYRYTKEEVFFLIFSDFSEA